MPHSRNISGCVFIPRETEHPDRAPELYKTLIDAHLSVTRETTRPEHGRRPGLRTRSAGGRGDAQRRGRPDPQIGPPLSVTPPAQGAVSEGEDSLPKEFWHRVLRVWMEACEPPRFPGRFS